MDKEYIINYFRNMECNNCPFSANCDALMNYYDCPSLCKVIEGDMEGIE